MLGNPEIVAVLLFFLISFFVISAILSWVAFFKVRALEGKVKDLILRSKPRPLANEAPKPAATKVEQSARVTERPKGRPDEQPNERVEKLKPDTTASNKSSPESVDLFAALERSFSGSWLVWLGAAVLTLGGIFVVKYAVDASYFGPWLRISIGILAGLIMLVSGHWLRGREIIGLPSLRTMAPMALSAAGLITLYGAVYSSYALYDLIPGPIAFILLAIIALVGLVLALLYGEMVALIGLVGGFFVPALVQSDTPMALALFGYVFFIAGAGLILAGLRNWRISGITALTGAFFWPLLWLIASPREVIQGQDGVFAMLYLLCVAALAMALNWRQHQTLPYGIRAISSWSASQLIGNGGPLLVAFLFVVLILQGGHQFIVLAGFAALCVGTLYVAWRRESLMLVPIFPALASVVVLLFWPESKAEIITDTARLNHYLGVPGSVPAGPSFLTALILVAGFYGFGGFLAQKRLKFRGIMASLSAFMPLALLFISYWRVSGLEHDWRMGAAAFVLALPQVLIVDWLARRAGGVAARPGPAAAYALGCNGAIALGIAMSVGQVWLSVGLAAQIPLIAFLWARLQVPVLKPAALVLALLVVARLTVFGEAFDQAIGPVPLFNWLLWGYGLPVMAMMMGAYLFLRGGALRGSVIVQGLEGAALASGVMLLVLETHHFLSDGDMRALPGFSEMGAHVISALAISAFVYWRFGPDHGFTLRWGRRIAFALGCAILASLVLLNPWTALSETKIGHMPILNALALAYFLPGALLVLHAVLFRKMGYGRTAMASMLGGASVFLLWLIMEVRRAFHGPNLHTGAVSNVENYLYSAVLLGFALILLGVGFWRRLPYLRYAALALVVAVTIKVFVFDLAALKGLLRGLSFLGLGAALMGISMFYQKIVLPAQTAENLEQDKK